MQPAPGGGYRTLELDNPAFGSAPVLNGYGANWTADAPAGVTIVGAYTPVNTVLVDCDLNADGFTAEYWWEGGAQPINYINDCNPSTGYGYGDGVDLVISPGSSFFGWGAGCYLKASCSTSSAVGAVLGVQGIRLTAEEDTGPSVVPNGANNLWYQAGHWIRGGGWSVDFLATDPSGVCGTEAIVDGDVVGDDAVDTSIDNASFTQCWPSYQATGAVDTASLPNGAATFTLSAVNAAGVPSSPAETLAVDNTPVTLSLATPNDPDPNVWVNHAVSVDASVETGPSGLGGISCTVDGATRAYPAGGISLNGTATHVVMCGASNNAYDVNGTPASSPTETTSVKIDETPPSIAFEPQTPTNPTALVVDTSDGQSGVASGQIEMRPASGGAWAALPTQFDGRHLLASFNDADLAAGSYAFQATSCDRAGNCASASRVLALPVRTPSVSDASFQVIKDPLRATVARERVWVGWHWVKSRRHGRMVRVRRGGHWKTVRVVHWRERCTRKRVRVGPHHGREKKVCAKPRVVLKTQERVAFGNAVTVHGLLRTAQGVPVPGAPVQVLAAPTNGLDQFTEAAVATSAGDGTWAVKLPAGPSRIIEAVYGGSATILPSSGQATVLVPASVRVLRVWPRRVAWGHKVHIEVQLSGGWLPIDGALVRLRLGFGNAKTTYGIQEHVSGDGRFEVTNTFGSAPAWVVRRYWLQECTLPEGDYPYAPACGKRVFVIVGGSPSPPGPARHAQNRSTGEGTGDICSTRHVWSVRGQTAGNSSSKERRRPSRRRGSCGILAGSRESPASREQENAASFARSAGRRSRVRRCRLCEVDRTAIAGGRVHQADATAATVGGCRNIGAVCRV